MASPVGIKVVEIDVESSPPPEVDDAADRVAQVAKAGMQGYPFTPQDPPQGEISTRTRLGQVPPMQKLSPSSLKEE